MEPESSHYPTLTSKSVPVSVPFPWPVELIVPLEQHDALSVFDDVEQATVLREDIWISAVGLTISSVFSTFDNSSIKPGARRSTGKHESSSRKAGVRVSPRVKGSILSGRARSIDRLVLS